MMGTPLYMSPEQARGARDVDGRTDIYAASVMFYRALTGELPYNAETLNELLFKIVLEDPKPLRELAPEVDEAFAAIVHKGLARELPQRFQSARAFQDEIVVWGKTLGRSSLSFAVTHASDRPPATPITLPDPSHQAASAASAGQPGSAARPGVAASAASAASGTPIAWSEAAPGYASSPKLVAATVLTPISSQPQSSPLAGAGVGSGGAPPSPTPTGPGGTAAPSNATLSSSSGPELSTSQSSTNEGLAIAEARTSPAVPLVDGPARPGAGANGGAKSSRGLILGIVGAGALAVVGIVAFGRGGSEKSPANGLTATASPSGASATPAESSAAKATPPSAAEIASAAASAAAVPDGATSATTQTPDLPVTATRRDPANIATARRPADPTTKPIVSPAASVSPATTAFTAPAQTPATTPSSTTAKPAGSARKFRTNLD